jgi:hypothetical protein
MTTGTCRNCQKVRPVPDEGTKQLFSGEKIAFVLVVTPCACGSRVVKLDLSQFDEAEPTRA